MGTVWASWLCKALSWGNPRPRLHVHQDELLQHGFQQRVSEELFEFTPGKYISPTHGLFQGLTNPTGLLGNLAFARLEGLNLWLFAELRRDRLERFPFLSTEIWG